MGVRKKTECERENARTNDAGPNRIRNGGGGESARSGKRERERAATNNNNRDSYSEPKRETARSKSHAHIR